MSRRKGPRWTFKNAHGEITLYVCRRGHYTEKIIEGRSCHTSVMTYGLETENTYTPCPSRARPVTDAAILTVYRLGGIEAIYIYLNRGGGEEDA